MSDQQLEGLGNIGLQNIRHSSVDIHQYIGKSLDYQQLTDRLNEMKELAILYTNNPEKKQEYNRKISDQEKMIEAFKADVVRLAETFGNIELYSGNMVKAKELFNEGKFREAGAMLNAADLEQEQEKLLQNKERLDTALRNNANAFLVKAQSAAMDFNNPDRFALAVQFFERSLAADKHQENMEAYIQFLCTHNKLSKAFPLAKEAVERAGLKGGLPLVKSLFQLGEIHYDWVETGEAAKIWQQALNLLMEIYEEHNDKHFIQRMQLVDALGILYFKTADWKEAERSFSEQVSIYENNLQRYPEYYGFYLAHARYKLLMAKIELLPFKDVRQQVIDMINETREQTDKRYGFTQNSLLYILSNFMLIFHRNKEYDAALALSDECLAICREEIKLNPEAMLPRLAGCLNNRGSLFIALQNYDAAGEAYREAETIHAELVKEESGEFREYYARSLEGVGKCAAYAKDYETAEEKMNTALKIREDMAGKNRELFLPELAKSIKDLAILQFKEEHFKASLERYREAEAMFRELALKTPENYELLVADCYFNAGLCYNKLGELEQAVKELEKCAEIRRRFADENPKENFLNFGTCLYNIAVIYTHHIIDRTKALKNLTEIIKKNKQYGFDEKEGLLFDLITDTAVLLIIWDKRDKGELVD